MDPVTDQDDRPSQTKACDACTNLLHSKQVVFGTRPGQNSDWSHTPSERTCGSLMEEFSDVVRKLLQHIVFVSILTLRLYMLPLLYLSHKLAMKGDSWYLATRHFVPFSGRVLTHCDRCCQRGGSVTLRRTWTNAREGIYATFKIMKTLYNLGKAIGDDPNTLQPEPVLLLDPPDSAIDVQSERERDSKIFDGDHMESQPESSAKASQIYHAALINGNTLDDILAAFERNKRNAATRNDHIVVLDGHVNTNEGHSNDQRTRVQQPGGHGYHNSSIQTTPERMLSPTEDRESSLCSVPKQGKDEKDEALQPPVNGARSVQEKAKVDFDNGNSATESSEHVSGSQAWDHRSARQSGERRVGSTTLKRCPTFVRRQNQAHVPERHVDIEKRSLAMLQERATRSTPALALGSPTKRAKLQRKVRVYQDPNKP